MCHSRYSRLNVPFFTPPTFPAISVSADEPGELDFAASLADDARSDSGLTFFSRVEKDDGFFSSVRAFLATGRESSCEGSNSRFGAGASCEKMNNG